MCSNKMMEMNKIYQTFHFEYAIDLDGTLVWGRRTERYFHFIVSERHCRMESEWHVTIHKGPVVAAAGKIINKKRNKNCTDKTVLWHLIKVFKCRQQSSSSDLKHSFQNHLIHVYCIPSGSSYSFVFVWIQYICTWTQTNFVQFSA